MKHKHISHLSILILLAASTPLVLSQSTTAEKPATEVKDTVQPGSLTAMIADSTTFSTLTKALKAAELDVILGAKGEFTVFAPTDEAFGKLPAEVLAKLLLPENKEKLRSLLLYHVIAGRMLAADLQDGDLKTMNGEKVKVDAGDDYVEVDGAKASEIDGAKIFNVDVTANNGVMHSLGQVLVPKSLDGFAGLKN